MSNTNQSVEVNRHAHEVRVRKLWTRVELRDEVREELPMVTGDPRQPLPRQDVHLPCSGYIVTTLDELGGVTDGPERVVRPTGESAHAPTSDPTAELVLVLDQRRARIAALLNSPELRKLYEEWETPTNVFMLLCVKGELGRLAWHSPVFREEVDECLEVVGRVAPRLPEQESSLLYEQVATLVSDRPLTLTARLVEAVMQLRMYFERQLRRLPKRSREERKRVLGLMRSFDRQLAAVTV